MKIVDISLKVINWILIIVGLFLLNLFLLGYLLRVDVISENISESRIDRELQSADSIYDFSPGMKNRLVNLELVNKFKLSYWDSEDRIPYSDIERYNPYPPILHLFNSEYVIYKKDYEIRQITILSGECDATPSILLKKARGEQTGFGDYFVTYIFYQSGLLDRSIDHNYDKIDWYSWRGGSYDGFEELWAFPLTIIQLLILIGVRIFMKRKKKLPLINHA